MAKEVFSPVSQAPLTELPNGDYRDPLTGDVFTPEYLKEKGVLGTSKPKGSK